MARHEREVIIGAVRRNPGRRNNAPLRRPGRPATGVPDVLFALATAGFTMAVVFVVASFVDNDVTRGDAGTFLARLFAGALTLASLFVFLLGVGLLRADRWQPDHYVIPMLLGLIIGGLDAMLFLIPIGSLLWAPFLLLVFALRPVRRGLGRMTAGRR
ncbi:MAG: hypothetical protein HYX53_04900 [Chloroflexi bacterium]|nr:hypothetical protein [Chloroflexota bacterium]